MSYPFGYTEKQCREVLHARFGEKWIPNHVTKKAAEARGEFTSATEPDIRRERAFRYGFQFDAFSKLLEEVRFWERVERQLGTPIPRGDPRIVPKDIALRMLNILNGNTQLDCEALVEGDGGRYLLHLLKAAQPAGNLSMPYIIAAMLFELLMQGQDTESMRFIAEQAAVTLDGRVGNEAQIAAHVALAKKRGGNPEFAKLLRPFAEELKLPENHMAHFRRGTKLPVDGLIPLIGFGYRHEAWWARKLAEEHREAGVLPVGHATPYEMKLLGERVTAYTEAELIKAILLIRQPFDYYNGIPDMPLLPPCPPVAALRILGLEMQSIDTAGNAKYSRKCVEEVARKLGRKPHIVLVASGTHSARAYAEFLKELHDIAIVSVFVCPPPGHEVLWGEKVSMLALVNFLCEYLKRLYMVAVP